LHFIVNVLEVWLWAFPGEFTGKGARPLAMVLLDEADGFLLANSQGGVRLLLAESETEPQLLSSCTALVVHEASRNLVFCSFAPSGPSFRGLKAEKRMWEL
jgi:hypothetical protein